MERLAGRKILSTDAHAYLWEDAVIAAHVWGDFARLETRAEATLEAERRLAKAKREPSEAEVEDAADAWRYEQDLISADDLQAWLARRELTFDEWLGWVRRTVCAQRSPVARPRRASAGEVESSLYVEAVCSGLIGEIVDQLAGRAAVFERASAERLVRAPAKAKVQAAVARLPHVVRRHGLFGRSAAEAVKGAERIATMDAAYERFVKSSSTANVLEREVQAHALEWTRIEGQVLAFPTEGPAREAALLIREDGLPIAKAGAVAKTTVRAVEHVLEDVGGPLRDRLTSAQPGELVGPIGDDDGFHVMLVTKRVVPAVDDRDIRARAQELVERRIVGAEIEKRVRWHERF